MAESRPNFKLYPNELFISTPLLNTIIKHSTVKKVIIEETTSELWYETYNGKGTIKFKNNMEYTGNLHYGLINNEESESPCTLIFPSGTKYVGTMINNEITGKGEYFFNNGSYYSGELLNGLRHGKGLFKTSNGILYDGDWKFGLKHGRGRLTQGDMEIEGQWIEGVISGKCRIKWKSGNIYDGQILDNKMNGNGYMVWNDKNEKYTGQWENNLQNGFGVYVWFDNKISVNKFFKDRYVGEWKDGRRDGYGLFFYSNGSIYEGFWKNDKKDGFGILKFQDRSNLIGLFRNDIFFSDLKDAYLYLKIDNLNGQQKEGTKKLNANKGPKSRRSSFFNVLNRPPTRIFEKKGTKIGIPIISEKEAKKEEIKDAKEKEKENDNLKLLKAIHEKEEKLIKSPEDEIKIKISIEDISIIDPFEKEMYKKLDDLILRNLSLISKLYFYSTWGDDIKLSDIGFSTGSPSFLNETKSKSMFKQQLQIKKERNSKDSNILVEENTQVGNDDKKEVNLIDNVYNNDLYYCLDLKNFWKFLRESGIITPNFSLAMIDRFIFKNPENQFDMFLIPEEIEKLNNNAQKIDDIYNFIYKSISNSKKIFEIKNKPKLDLSAKIMNRINRQRQPDSDYLQRENTENDILEKFYDYHDEKNIILLRYFYEILIRLAYLRFDEEKNMDIKGRLKILLELIKVFMKNRKKNKVDSSLTASILDPKLKNMDDALENYIFNHYEILKNIFKDLYKYNCTNEKVYTPYDMTISYRFFFDKIILNSEKFSELFSDKMLYIDLISWNFKDKKITSKSSSKMTDNELFEYLESLYDYEMIFREFCELIFYISRKYFMFYEIDTKWEDNKIGLLTKEEEKKIEEDEKRNKKKKKTTRKIKNIDIYMIVLDEIINAKNILFQKKSKNKVNIYYYPILKTHKIIERNEEERKQKLIEEKRKAMDKLRYEKERRTLKEEEINIYKEEDAPKSNTEEESSEYD